MEGPLKFTFNISSTPFSCWMFKKPNKDSVHPTWQGGILATGSDPSAATLSTSAASFLISHSDVPEQRQTRCWRDPICFLTLHNLILFLDLHVLTWLQDGTWHLATSSTAAPELQVQEALPDVTFVPMQQTRQVLHVRPHIFRETQQLQVSCYIRLRHDGAINHSPV